MMSKLGLGKRLFVTGIALVGVSSVVHAQCQSGGSHTITFSEFPVGTVISSNYANKGVLFASGSGYPFITTDGANPSSPVLSGSPKFSGPITAAFVSPVNTGERVATENLTFQAGYFDAVGTTSITYFDVNQAPLGTVTNSGLQIQSFTAPPETAGFTINTTDSAGYAIDNLAYTLGDSSRLKIDQPTVGETFALGQNDYTRSPDVSFSASGPGASGQVSWEVTMEYDTGNPRGLPGLSSSFKTNGTSAKKLYYQSRGGRGRIQASSADGEACPFEYFYVVGTQIPDDVITNRLIALYSRGATPRLFTGIAFRESSYRQFAVQSKYGISAAWPNESYDGGSHIGLMQVESSVEHAWDWLKNTKAAADLFDEKLRIVASRERRVRQANRGLRRLTDLESENWALLLYGPYAGLGAYYVPAVQPDGSVDWVVNPNNPNGVGYVAEVRANIR